MDKNTDFPEFSTLWSAAHEQKGRRSPSDASIALAFRTLADYELIEVKRAITAHMRDPDVGQYPPGPSDVIRLIAGDSESQGLAAWSKVEDALRRIGPHQTVVFDDAIIMSVLEDMGGWPKLAKLTDAELPHRAREFTKRYQRLRKAPPARHPSKLPGIVEQQNQSYGRPPDPILLGNSAAALEVHKRGQQLSCQPMRLHEAMQKLSDSARELTDENASEHHPAE